MMSSRKVVQCASSIESKSASRRLGLCEVIADAHILVVHEVLKLGQFYSSVIIMIIFGATFLFSPFPKRGVS